MVRRAAQTTWVLRRMRSLGVDQDTLVNYWKAEGRVHLELACPVWNSSRPVSRPRQGPAYGHGRPWEVGSLPHPPVAGSGAGVTGTAAPYALPALCPENGPRLKASGPVCPDRSQAEAGETCANVPDSTDPDSYPL